MERGAGVGDDDFAGREPFKDFRRSIGDQPDADFPRFHRIAFDHLHGEMVDRGARDRDAATAAGVDIGASEAAELERWISRQ